MSIVREVLGEEYNRLVILLNKYNKELATLPRGTVSIKTKAGHEYAYLVYRDKGKIVFKYLGKASSPAVKNLRDRIVRRREYQAKIKIVKQDLKELERALRGKKI